MERAAGWLAGAGAGPGDVVCWQTPNWWEAHVLGLAIWHAGAVSCPVVPVYREHELRQIIGQVRPAVVITAGEFRGFKHAEAFDELLAEAGLDGAARVILRGSRPRWTPFDEVVAASPLRPGAAVPAKEPCLILFTSGTTSAAKGAVHTSQTLLAETSQLAGAWAVGWEDACYMAAPLQHITGVLNAMTIPLLTGACSIIAERWLPDRAVAAIAAHRVTWTAGATVFLQELTEAARAAGVRLPLRMFACGGASVPRVVLERSEEQGIPAARVYGLTELPTVTVMNRVAGVRPPRRRPTARSRPVSRYASSTATLSCRPGSRANCWSGDRNGSSGTWMRRPTDAAIDGEGWLRTGDVGFLDGDGYVTVTGRLKDIVNRGGEKFSARDIEDLLMRHPAVRQAAVVPGPDARFGEVPVAFVVLAPGSRASARRSRPASAGGRAGSAEDTGRPGISPTRCR